jgi:hypothetical protein
VKERAYASLNLGAGTIIVSCAAYHPNVIVHEANQENNDAEEDDE